MICGKIGPVVVTCLISCCWILTGLSTTAAWLKFRGILWARTQPVRMVAWLHLTGDNPLLIRSNKRVLKTLLLYPVFLYKFCTILYHPIPTHYFYSIPRGPVGLGWAGPGLLRQLAVACRRPRPMINHTRYHQNWVAETIPKW